MAHDPLDRATAALAGVALGDAMGMPSQTLTRAEIAAA
jgi:ADP-ribosylglycohydrolase